MGVCNDLLKTNTQEKRKTNMKNFFVTILALFAVSNVMAQNVRFDNPPDTVSVTSLAVRGIGSDHSEWRSGLAFPVMNFRDGNRQGYPAFATGNVWVMSDTAAFRNMFLGAGFDVTLMDRKNMRLGLTAGWSADFSNLEHIRNGSWGVGPTLTIRF